MPDPNPSHWLVVYTKPRQEAVARNNLQRQGYVVSLPCLTVRRRARSGGGWVNKAEPLFPRYLFIQAADGQSLAPVRSTLGVSDLVRVGNTPARIDAACVAEFEALCQAQGEQTPAERAGLVQGQRVRVLEGPLAEFEGLITQVADDRVRVLFELLGRPVDVVLPVAGVERV